MDGQDGQDKKGAGEPSALIRRHTRRRCRFAIGHAALNHPATAPPPYTSPFPNP